MNKNTFLVLSQDILLSGLNTTLAIQAILLKKKPLLSFSYLFYLIFVSSNFLFSENLTASTGINSKKRNSNLSIIFLYTMIFFFFFLFLSIRKWIHLTHLKLSPVTDFLLSWKSLSPRNRIHGAWFPIDRTVLFIILKQVKKRERILYKNYFIQTTQIPII